MIITTGSYKIIINSLGKRGGTLNILMAMDSFKGSLTSLQAEEAVERGIKKANRAFNKNIEIIKVPMADGGEGTTQAIISSIGGKIINVRVRDPLFREIDSYFGILPDNTAIVEMAAASGINLLSASERNPLITTSYGTGQLIKAALDYGCKKIILAIGGSATNDGGAGMIQALGVRMLDKNNNEIAFGGGELSNIQEIKFNEIDSRIKECQFTVASDVENILCGKYGASAVYGPQKGASPEVVNVLDRNLQYFSKIVMQKHVRDVALIPGSGAAGGLGFAAIAFLNAKVKKGLEVIAEITDLDRKIQNADIVVTGEGSTDYQTLYGKVVFGIAAIAKKLNKTLICLSGAVDLEIDELYDAGVTSLFSIVNGPISIKEAMEHGERLLEKKSENIFRLLFRQGV